MDAAVAEKVNPIPTYSQCSCTPTPVTGLPQLLETYFCLYAQQIFNEADANDVLTVSSKFSNQFGQIRSDDWTLLDGLPGPNAKVVGRIQGQHTRSNTETSKLDFNIIFQDDNRFKGSLLAVRGEGPPDADDPELREWAILGGTRQLSLAQGVVYVKIVSQNANHIVRKLCFHIFYRPLEKSNMD